MRPAATALLVVCVATTVLLGTLFAHHRQAGALDAAVDARIQAGLGHWRVLNDLAALGDVTPVIAITAGFSLACLVTRWWRAAVLVAVVVPAAAGITELILKPLIDRTLMGDLSFPSGHETRVFALATAFAVLLANPAWPRIPAAVRLFLAAVVVLAACAVAVALVGLGHHYFTDTVGGAAVGTAVVLATALVLDRLAPEAPRDRARLPDGPPQGHAPSNSPASAWRDGHEELVRD